MNVIDVSFLTTIPILIKTGGFAVTILALAKVLSVYFVNRTYNKSIIKVVSEFRNDLTYTEMHDLY